MAIRHLVTRGFGNGTFSGTIALIVMRGYGTGAVPVVTFAAAGPEHTANLRSEIVTALLAAEPVT